MSKRVLISGVAPGPSGVGRVIEFMIDNSKNIKFVHPPRARELSLIKSFKELNFYKFFLSVLELIRGHARNIAFKLKVNFLSGSDIILLHPQTIGYRNVERLISRNTVSVYVMDNSFFCLKSYNYLTQNQKPCLLCLGGKFENAELNKCRSFPVDYSYNEYGNFVQFLRFNYRKVNFLVQSDGQLELLKMQFGVDIRYTMVGLLTSDLFESPDEWRFDDVTPYDIVFHGDQSLAKGSHYVLQIATLLKDYSFLFPFSAPEGIDVPSNVTFSKMNWRTGLKDYILRSKLTFCPSIWSAPIEGSVMKTLKLGVPLALYDAPYGFCHEIPSDVVLKLSGDLEKDCLLLQQFLKNDTNYTIRDSSKKFALKKLSEMSDSYQKVFDLKINE